ncbi:MAG TPA: T9SS type A sorting domain-containing protein, partial [Mariniflexile sp.]|nr:T9SS type A sorting domain-containing protein [Mariniflexile sp.]
LLVGVDAATSNNFDMGYDALLNETNNEDMYWHFSDSKFIIQAVNNFSSEQVLPLGITISKTGLATIRIDSLENIDANANIFVHDKQLNTYHNLKDGNYQVYVTPGIYTERFEITFANAQALNTEGAENSGLQAYFSNEKESIIVHNPHAMQLKSVVVLNILGQSVLKFESNTHDTYITHKTKNMATGAYIIKLNTATGVISKKVLVQKN